jgi:hypothetical protein
VKEISLPVSDFRILVHDPENEDSGIFASWRQPGIFESFVLLCRKERAPNMETLRKAGLLNWDYEFRLTEPNLGWVEYRGCVITSSDWAEVLSDSNDLFDALWPRATATIALRAGLRAPNQRAWLEGYGPEVIIHAVENLLRFVVRDVVHIDTPIIDKVVETKQYLELPELSNGDYLLQVYCGTRMLAQRTLMILPWRALRCAEPERAYSIRLGSFTLQGALIGADGEAG